MVRLADLINTKFYRTGDGKLHEISKMDDKFLVRVIEHIERKAEERIRSGKPDKSVFPKVYDTLLSEFEKRQINREKVMIHA